LVKLLEIKGFKVNVVTAKVSKVSDDQYFSNSVNRRLFNPYLKIGKPLTFLHYFSYAFQHFTGKNYLPNLRRHNSLTMDIGGLQAQSVKTLIAAQISVVL